MRYFFHVVGIQANYRDDEGSEFIRAEDAMAHAAVIARELEEDRNLDGYWIVVVDKDQSEIGRVLVGSEKPSP